ncbi:hypothetical protein L1987_56144 [Smallanthus sonchifolius]|uniref:Uncharacterized protein n=2 Tax=Smallanthus sonchifolius TaxID=185202 RepID=A0ACB9EC04_9ASTR|nr:hypothetical protein L1987_56142 [Smallanthus sonchifolius]KAI3756324.1 hypothetical protein L1987_56144 [Smallanthus sonchifolius]
MDPVASLPFSLAYQDIQMLKEELQLLQEVGSYGAEVVKVIGKSKCVVKVKEQGRSSQANSVHLTRNGDLGKRKDVEKVDVEALADLFKHPLKITKGSAAN